MPADVKFFLSVLTRALRRARHLEKTPYPTKARFNQLQVWNSVRPMHLFDPLFDHDC